MYKRIAAFGASIAAAAGLSFLAVQLVSAHNHPVLFDPAPGAVLEEAPTEVSAWFVGPVRRDENWTYLQVRDSDGNRVDTGEITLNDDRRQMTVRVEADLPPGRYLVTWRNWDDEDGFIMGDCYRFYIGQEGADAAIADGQRLFGGSGCEAIGVSGRDGTPTPEQLTPTPAPDPDSPSTGATGPQGDDDDEDDGIPAWTLAIAAIGGLVVGGVGMKLAGSRV